MVRVLYFAASREIAGCGEQSIALEASCTMREFRGLIVQKHPGLKPYLDRIKLARNGEYVSDDAVVSSGDEVAVIPPVAGG